MASTTPGTPPPVPTSSTVLLRLEELGECQAIDQIAGDELLVVGVPRQIDLRVPIPEQLAVSFQQSDLRLRQFDLMPSQRGR